MRMQAVQRCTHASFWRGYDRRPRVDKGHLATRVLCVGHVTDQASRYRIEGSSRDIARHLTSTHPMLILATAATTPYDRTYCLDCGQSLEAKK